MRENIRIGRPTATDAEVEWAAAQAGCDSFIARFPAGYDTNAGDAGARLSGGERQRLALARALLKDAPIVILDEATAFTDPENEDKLQRAIDALTKDKTLIVIAHRLQTIMHADQILVLKDGAVSARGTHEELLVKSDTYRAMWQTHVQAMDWQIVEKANAKGQRARGRENNVSDHQRLLVMSGDLRGRVQLSILTSFLDAMAAMLPLGAVFLVLERFAAGGLADAALWRTVLLLLVGATLLRILLKYVTYRLQSTAGFEFVARRTCESRRPAAARADGFFLRPQPRRSHSDDDQRSQLSRELWHASAGPRGHRSRLDGGDYPLHSYF